MHVYIFLNRQFPSPRGRKTEKEERKKKQGKKEFERAAKGGRKVWFPEWFFTWSIPSLFTPSSTRSFASRLLTRRSLLLTRGYRFSKPATAPCTTLVEVHSRILAIVEPRETEEPRVPVDFMLYVRTIVRQLWNFCRSLFRLIKDLLKVRAWNHRIILRVQLEN